MTDDVSRETPPVPDEVRGAFPRERLRLAERYADWLADAGVVRGLIGPREAPRLWTRHLANCAGLATLVPAGARVCDLGSGAGLPGLVLAICRPDLEVTLVEPLLRRTTFLEEVVADLGLAGVSVRRGRAESLHGSADYEVVTARALAPLGRLLDWAMPLVSPHGALLAMKGERAADEVGEARDDLARWHAAEPEVVRVGAGASTATIVRVTWADPSRVSWPLTPPGRGEGPDRPRPSRKQRRRP